MCVFVKVMWVCARYMAAEDISLDSMPVDAERRERVWWLVHLHAWVGQIVTFFETASLAAPWAP